MLADERVVATKKAPPPTAAVTTYLELLAVNVKVGDKSKEAVQLLRIALVLAQNSIGVLWRGKGGVAMSLPALPYSPLALSRQAFTDQVWPCSPALDSVSRHPAPRPPSMC